MEPVKKKIQFAVFRREISDRDEVRTKPWIKKKSNNPRTPLAHSTTLFTLFTLIEYKLT